MDVTISEIEDLPVSRGLEPGLSTISDPLHEAGELVVELALGTPANDYRRTLPGKLVVRGSSA